MKTALSVWSCNYYFKNKIWSNADFIDFVGTTGAMGVELLSMFWNQAVELKPVQEALKRNDLKLACFGACNNFVEPDEQKHKLQVQEIMSSIDMASLLGAEVVRVFSGDPLEGITYEQARGWIVKGLKQAAAYAADKGITLCLENHGQFSGRAQQVQEMIQEVDSPFLRMTFDTGNFLLVDENPDETIIQLKDLIRHVHFKDFMKVDADYQAKAYTSLNGQKYSGQVPGEGSIDLNNIVSQLAEVNYEGWLTVEYEGNEEQKQASVRAIHNLISISRNIN
jgi:sugar phosphate isomerase/epimerase